MVRKIKGKSKGSKVNHLKQNKNLITSTADIAKTLEESFLKTLRVKTTSMNFT